MLKTHRVRGDDSYAGRNLLEKPRVQPVCWRDKHGVGSFGRGEQLLGTERKLILFSSGAIIAVDTVFNFLRITAGYHQNGFSHARHILYSCSDDSHISLDLLDHRIDPSAQHLLGETESEALDRVKW